MDKQLSFIPIGGLGDVTRNMYLYEYNDKILIVDCGLGFADETMVGVNLLLPDITYLLESKKKIVGMVLTHGHEDHIGALPFILPQLPAIPIFGTPLTAALANEKLKEFGTANLVKTFSFDQGELILDEFKINFIRVTHSVPDTAHLFIKTPAGNIYHGSDFKFDLTPYDGQKVEFSKITKLAENGVLCLMSDSLGAEKKGSTLSEENLSESFEKAARGCVGKFIVTTYSSNISRLNQAIEAGKKTGRKVCFVGRSLIKAKEVAQRMNYLKSLEKGMEISVDQIKNYSDKQLLLLIAGSQGQENSAMSRVANDEFREIKLTPEDVVIFSADPIPGNEVMINSVIDSIAKKGTKVIYSDVNDGFHVSGHGSANDIMLLMSLTKPRNLIPVGGTYRQMVAYLDLAKKIGYEEKNVFLIEDGQRVVFKENNASLGDKIKIKNVYVDEISGEEVESFVLRDRKKISEGGIVVLIVEVESSTGEMLDKPQIIVRGFSSGEQEILVKKLIEELRKSLVSKKGRVVNWLHLRNLIGEVSERRIYKEFHRRPLVLPVVIEV
ncbi:ribonuclease J [Candidatus Microgenomates bacterium]|nr:MAG: ribonuclease J [Candidatus Microgenomates bacterium]